MADETCATCRFWLHTANNHDHAGECRRHAPPPMLHITAVREDAHVGAVWLCTNSDEWCGEHQPRRPLRVVE